MRSLRRRPCAALIGASTRMAAVTMLALTWSSLTAAAGGAPGVLPAAPADTAAAESPAASNAAQPDPHAPAAAPQVPGGHPPIAGHPPMGANAGDDTLSKFLATGSPFASERHKRQAEVARTGRMFVASSSSKEEPQMAPGTIGVVVRGADNKPLAGAEVRLTVLHESIEHGNSEKEVTATSNADGNAGFTKQPTDTSYQYEVVVRQGSARYSSGPFRLKTTHGQLVLMHVYPTTPSIDDTFIVTRALYVVEPRDDVFQVQVLFRFHNTNPMTWVPEHFSIPLPAGASAFRPANTTGDIRLLEQSGEVGISGSFTPGEHEISYSFQLPNDGEPTARLAMPLPPNMVDARLFVEASNSMTLSVSGLDAPTETRGKGGQRALLASRDFLTSTEARPTQLIARIAGLPSHGWGAIGATVIAATLALFGIAFATSREGKASKSIADADRQRARQLLLDELVEVEKAFADKRIGPKTRERTRQMLLDALARIEANAA